MTDRDRSKNSSSTNHDTHTHPRPTTQHTRPSPTAPLPLSSPLPLLRFSQRVDMLLRVALSLSPSLASLFDHPFSSSPVAASPHRSRRRRRRAPLRPPVSASLFPPLRPLCFCTFPQRRPPSPHSILSLIYLSLRIACVACSLQQVAIPSTWAPVRAGAARLASLSKPALRRTRSHRSALAHSGVIATGGRLMLRQQQSQCSLQQTTAEFNRSSQHAEANTEKILNTHRTRNRALDSATHCARRRNACIAGLRQRDGVIRSQLPLSNSLVAMCVHGTSTDVAC